LTRDGKRRLTIESLETRQVMAPLLGIQVNLYEDAGGVPGALITDDTVDVGATFFVEITAQDVRHRPKGIGGLGLNIQWDPAAFRVAQPFDPLDPATSVVTDKLPLFRSGTLNDDEGRITDLGGSRLRSAAAGQTIGLTRPEQFSLIRFEALSAVDRARLWVNIGRSGIGMQYRGRLQSSDILIERQRITVAAPSASEAAAVDAAVSDEATDWREADNAPAQPTPPAPLASVAAVTDVQRVALWASRRPRAAWPVY
jgi:hypothetical protein